MRDYPAIRRKITRRLFSAQSLVSAALIAMATVNAIVGAEMSGVVAWAGVPAAVLLGASAIGALFWGFLMERRGRRVGLALGLGIGILGSFLSGWAVINITFLLFLAGMACLGLAQSAMQLGRYAAADVSPLKAAWSCDCERRRGWNGGVHPWTAARGSSIDMGSEGRK